MFCDKDTAGRYSVQDLSAEQLETLRRALTSFRIGLIQTGTNVEALSPTGKEMMKQYRLAGDMVQKIETINKSVAGYV